MSYVVKIWWPLPLITAGHVRRLSINNEKEQIGRLVHLVEETDWGVSHKWGNNVLEYLRQSALESAECADRMLTVAPKWAQTAWKQSWHIVLPRFFRKKQKQKWTPYKKKFKFFLKNWFVILNIKSFNDLQSEVCLWKHFWVRSIEIGIITNMNATAPFLNYSLLNSDRSRMMSSFRRFGCTYFLCLYIDSLDSGKCFIFLQNPDIHIPHQLTLLPRSTCSQHSVFQIYSYRTLTSNSFNDFVSLEWKRISLPLWNMGSNHHFIRSNH